MADEGKLRTQTATAARAKAERESKLIDGFFVRAMADCHEVFARSEPDQVAVREIAKARLDALGDLESCYQQLIATGEFAALELTRISRENG